MRTLKRALPDRLRMVVYWGISCLAIFVLCVSFLSVLRFFRTSGLTPRFVYQLITKKYIALKQSNNRTSILLLGIPGGQHDGSDLTDTMVVVSIHLKSNDVSLISIPRDIWSDTLKDKVNSAYHYGEEKKKNGGLVLSKVVVEDIIGMPIHYVLRIDFEEFTRLIDTIGGIDVSIPNSFTDTHYPIDKKGSQTCEDDLDPTCLYTTVTFEKGIEHMSGARALIYARSRHAKGEEGGDFARSRRQQGIIIAVLQTILHPFKWISYDRLVQFLSVTSDTIARDLNTGEAISILSLLAGSSVSRMHMIPIEAFFENPNEAAFGGRFVLTPRDSWDTIHEAIRTALR